VRYRTVAGAESQQLDQQEGPSVANHDVNLTSGDVQQLSSPDQVAAFFGRLGYDVAARLQQTPAALGITPEAVQRKIQRIERIADHEQGALQVYFVQLDSVTVEATRALARSFRDRARNYLLVLTAEYQQLDFVLPACSRRRAFASLMVRARNSRPSWSAASATGSARPC
jgi:rubrerythrin